MAADAAFPKRYYLVGICFLAAFTCYLDRVGFPLAYAAMVQNVDVANRVEKSVQGSIHSAFYVGYTATQIPGGLAATRFGGRKVLTVSFVLWGTLSLLMPSDGTATNTLWVLRAMMGCCMGVVFPAIHAVLVVWIPQQERSRAVSLFTSGMYFGSAAATLSFPQVIQHIGVGAAPKFVGLIALGWVVLWRTFTGDPKTAGSVGGLGLLPGGGARRAIGVPMGHFVRCPAIWAIIINNFTFHYAFFVLMSWMPTFYHQGLGVDPSSFGMLKTIPYLIMGCCSNVSGMLADHLIQRKVTVVRTRKLLNTAGFVSATVSLLALPKCTTVGSAIFVSSVALGSLAIARGGYSVNHMDIAPRHAGVLMGLSNGAGSMAGMIGPWFTGMILDRSEAPWKVAFAAPAWLCLLGAAVYLLFASGDRLFE
mmetsp:Transcript_38375/g.95232  ORF Transcript_38375/g.95232 Transcript_38375/m.95232 type:complete len:421 (-) Transcript_38375:292-1554(-)|eukprot:CAMPEP_0197588224 /NCGR_PEP_ID=MMETSP1326-20131121/9584_1 /TAXON_ID=1155430 /ORGANISM="Genus nov. species nov., Strain RCC2288" /LENGTH=420 /DNA_ID=CAMNT_0043153027 /DNA_START=578 /DNA_END=1840 /DNA_ORIENTATION=-